MTDTNNVHADTPKPHTAGLTALEPGDSEADVGSEPGLLLFVPSPTIQTCGNKATCVSPVRKP